MNLPNQSFPPVFFNHLYIVLDDKTYRAIQSSDFLKIAFPGLEKRATRTAAGETWYGTYFYAQENYLEFFGSATGPVMASTSRSGHWHAGAQEGWAGLAFSVDQPGGANAVRDAILNKFGYEPFHELRQLITKDQPVNWFYNIKLAERLGLGSFESWVMEYHPEIFSYKGIPLPDSAELTRKAYLSPWNKERPPMKAKPSQMASADAAHSVTPIPGTSNQPVFSNVIGATIHMDDQRANRFAEILQLLGYQHQHNGITHSLSAHGFTLTIQPEEAANDGYRLSVVRLAMARPSIAPMTFVFAPRSRLVLNDDLTADWYFGV